MSKHRWLPFITLAASVSLAACNTEAPNTSDGVTLPPTATATPATSATPTPAGTPTPETSPSETPNTPTPVASPTPAETPTPIATPISSAAPTTSPDPSPVVSATPQDDISIVERTTFNGKVFDDTNAPLDGVLVKAVSLNSSVSYTAETTTAGGTYAFNNAPAGIQLEITASRDGYTTRNRVEVLKSNKQGDPDANRYDFGTDGSTAEFGVDYNALSDKPEVVQVSPNRNAAGIDPGTQFVITFSEPMDRKTVEDNFEIRSYTTEKLTVDTSNNASTLTGSVTIDSVAGTRVWDKSAFNISWNTDDTVATFVFLNDRKLPTDKDSDKVPDYQVSFERQDSNLKDKSGITRSEDYFKLTRGDFERTYKFSINSDEQEPGVSTITAQTAENSGISSNGDAIRVRFTEPMIHYTLGPTIAGGMGGVASQAAAANNSITGAQAAANYQISVNRNGTLLLDQATWSSLGGSVVFDTNDPTHRTVLMLPPTVNGNSQVTTRPEDLDTIPLSATFSDGNSQSVNTFPFRLSGPGLTNNFEAQYNVGGDGASRTINLTFVYADGTTETVTTAALDTAPSAADVKAVLDGLTNGTPWNVTDGDGGDFAAADQITLSLNNGATRLSSVPVNGNKNIAWVTFANTAGTAFANDALGQTGTTASTVIVPINSDTRVLEAVLNRSLDGNGTANKFSVSESSGTAGLFEAGDNLSVAINGNPTVSGREITRFTVSQTGAFGSDDLNAPASGLSLFVGIPAGQPVDLYRPGDNVFVKVNTTVLDPAGNSLDSSNESANANAS